MNLPENTIQTTKFVTKTLTLLLLIALSVSTATAGEAISIGGERIVFTTPKNDQYPCGSLSGSQSYWNYTLRYNPWFDGPIAPISYFENGGNKLRFNASVGGRNFRMVSNLHGSGEGAWFEDPRLDCNPVFTGAFNFENGTFAWAEWLYGTFRNAENGKVYSAVYNEYYGGYYSPFAGDGYGMYSGTGIAVSDNNVPHLAGSGRPHTTS